jgi:hypothetical protein
MENLIAGIFALLIGGVGLWTGFMQLRNRAAFSHWKTTQAKLSNAGHVNRVARCSVSGRFATRLW